MNNLFKKILQKIVYTTIKIFNIKFLGGKNLKYSILTVFILIFTLVFIAQYCLEKKAQDSQAQQAAKNAPIYFADGNKFMAEKEYDKSISYFKKAQGADPQNYSYNSKLGLAYYLNKNYQEAIRYTETSIELAPNDAFKDYSYNILGNIYRDKKDTEKAIACYQEAIKLNYRDQNAYLNISSLLSQEGKINEAINIIKEGYNKNPENKNLSTNLAKLLNQAGQSSKAEEINQKL